jgi:hypothetical protein
LKNLNRVPKNTPYRYNTKQLSEIVEALGTEYDYEHYSDKALTGLMNLFETTEVYV